MDDVFVKYEHAPPHLFRADACYIVTCGTYQKQHFIKAPERKEYWVRQFRRLMVAYGWEIVAWVVLDNHYHFMANAPSEGAGSLSNLIRDLHRATAKKWNAEDRTPGRHVWCNYWDTCITNERSFNARINYVHWNAWKHKKVDHPIRYPFSSYGEYMAAHPDLMVFLEKEYPIDRVKVEDDF